MLSNGKFPVAQLGGPTIEHGANEAAFNDTVAGLPPVAPVSMPVDETAETISRNSKEVEIVDAAPVIEDVTEDVILPAKKNREIRGQRRRFQKHNLELRSLWRRSRTVLPRMQNRYLRALMWCLTRWQTVR